jgi:hypothetical protein
VSQYSEIDSRIISAIELRKNPLYTNIVCAEADRLAVACGVESFRVIDRRLQALRKKGTIKHYKKGERTDGIVGWCVE